MISDVFTDACLGLSRDVWNVGFLHRDDNMGSLFSKGRTMYPKENSPFEKDMEDGQTYYVERQDFLFVAPAFPGDRELAEKLRR